MMGFSEALSTITACMFMAQSVSPIPTPKSNKPTINIPICDIAGSKGSSKQKAMVEATISLRQPNFAAIAPVKGIAISAPTPKQRSNNPSVASFAPVLALTKGTIAAHEAVAKPAIKKIIRVATCSFWLVA